MALLTSVFVISTLYAFMASGTAPVLAASDADSAVAASMAFPLITCSTMVARIGAGAPAPRAILLTHSWCYGLEGLPNFPKLLCEVPVLAVNCKLAGMSALDGTLKF